MLVPDDRGGGAPVEGHDRHAAGEGLVHGRCVDLLLPRLDEDVEGGLAGGPLEAAPLGDHLGAGGAEHLGAVPVPECHQPDAGQPGHRGEPAEHLAPLEVPDVADDQLTAVGGVRAGPAVVQRLVTQAGVVVVQVDPWLPGAWVQHQGGYAEPLGRLGRLQPEPVRVDEVDHVGTGQRHRLADGGDRCHPARPEHPGTPERRLSSPPGEDDDVVPGVDEPGRDLPGDVGGRCARRHELLGDQCDPHGPTLACRAVGSVSHRRA